MTYVLKTEGGPIIAESATLPIYNRSRAAWETDAGLYSDLGETLIIEEIKGSIKIGPIAFQMLFTPQEMIAADELKATDKILASFWKLIDDPRTNVIDLGLESVQNAIEYTLMAVKAAGVAVDVPARKAAILSGVLK